MIPTEPEIIIEAARFAVYNALSDPAIMCYGGTFGPRSRGKVCSHDDDFLCECRKQAIMDRVEDRLRNY